MDVQYDKDAAAALLHSIATARTQSVKTDTNIYQLSDFETSTHHIMRTQNPTCYRLVHCQNDGINDIEETVVRVQGILVSKELPPAIWNSVLNRSERAKNRFTQTARQAVSVTGFGTNLFEQAVRNAVKTYDVFKQYFPEGKLHSWQPERSDDHLVLESHARYFTPKRYADMKDIRDFEPGVDRDGFLKQLQGTKFVHTIDNVVHYFESKPNSESNSQYCKIDPTRFQIGDLVEVALSFICLPVQQGYVKMFLALRAVTLLDDRIREEAHMKRIDAMIVSKPLQRTLKRKALYTDEDDRKSTKIFF